MGPMCRIETEHRRCSGPSATGFHGCATSSPMAAMRAANCAMPSRGMVTGPSRSSSDPTRPMALRCCRADGWSNARSPGSADADASPRTGRKPSKAPAPGPSSPASDSSHAGSQDIATQRKLLCRALNGLLSNAKFEARSARSASPMELRWLEDFLALAEQRTFARAAAMRRITQPAFGRRIRALEEWLGTRLFVRSAQGAVLTPAGKFLRAPAEELTRNLYQLRQATLEVADREASTLSVAATHSLSFMFFPSWIRNHVLFGTLGPVNLISDTLEACEDIMLRGEADVLLCH